MGLRKKVAFYEFTTAPTGEVVTRDLVKSNANIDHDDDDTLIDFYIETAVEEVERLTNRLLRPAVIRGNYATFEVAKTEYWYFIDLERTPITGVTSVERYNRETDAYEVVPTADYVVEQTSGFWRIVFYPYTDLSYLESLYYRDEIPYPIRVNFNAGYQDANAVPAKLRMAVVQYATWLYNNRGDCADEKLPPHLDKLIGGCRVLRIFG